MDEAVLPTAVGPTMAATLVNLKATFPNLTSYVV